MNANIDAALKKLAAFILNNTERCVFNPPAKHAEITLLEKKLKLQLPASYKSFLSFANGGMIISKDLVKLLVREDGLETVKWNSNYLFGLPEIEESYREMKNWNFGYPTESILPFPFIPFCRTSVGEKLVFINNKKNNEDSAVLDAFHEDQPEEWGLVAGSFSLFLDDYIANAGAPDVIGREPYGHVKKTEDADESRPPEKEKTEEIISRTSDALSYMPTDHWALIERGMAYVELGKFSVALNDFNAAISLVGSNPFYYSQRGSLFSRIGKTRAALIDFDIAVKLRPDDAYYLDLRAETLYKSHKIDEALKDLGNAISIDEKDLLAYLIREDIYRFLGKDDLADADARMIEKLQEEE